MRGGRSLPLSTGTLGCIIAIRSVDRGFRFRSGSIGGLGFLHGGAGRGRLGRDLVREPRDHRLDG